jgi:Uma2 family endonuclease
MSTLLTPSPSIPTVADLLDRLGGIPAERVRYYPLPGTATEQDVVDIEARENRLFELVDGVLVEKPVGYEESLLAMFLGTALTEFVEDKKLGWVTGEAGMMRVLPGQVRMPDIGFVSRARAPDGRRPKGPVASISPDLAVEVLSASNTAAEMTRKRREYFEGGTRLVWLVDPIARTVAVYTSPETPIAILQEHDTLDGGELLPGFALSLRTLFARLDD